MKSETLLSADENSSVSQEKSKAVYQMDETTDEKFEFVKNCFIRNINIYIE